MLINSNIAFVDTIYTEQLWISIEVQEILHYMFLNYGDVIMLGVININLLNTKKNDASKFHDLLSTVNLKQVINEPTRIDRNTSTVLVIT